MRDYAPLCPTGWADLGDGDMCEGPAELGARVESFGGLTPREKGAKARSLAATYECMGACKVNWTAACPQGWAEDAEGNCNADAAYDGPCVASAFLKNLNAVRKEEWAGMCGVSWPCA